MNKKPNFIIEVENLKILQDDVGVGKIVELPPNDAGLVAPFIPNHPDTIYVASSGVCLADGGGYFSASDQLLAIEWVRHETNPRPKEPEVNVYRYIFGLSKDGSSCLGYEVTQPYSDPVTGQVADHHTTFDVVTRRHLL